MTKIQAIIREERVDAVVERLVLIGVRGLTLSAVKGSGSHGNDHFAIFRGGTYKVDFLSKVLLEWVGPEDDADGVARAIEQQGATGKLGDGRIFISHVEEAVRIRTGERGLEAV
ncbi:MAG: P-II family nitrogen regulator [Myxococcota bacterium]|nr:P-II family nitrogen regulator [Myxococcota bacterium]